MIDVLTRREETDFIPVEVIDSELGITLKEYEEGVRLYEMKVGTLGIVGVWDVDATKVSEEKWQDIRNARGSYVAVWGGNGTIKKIEEDQFDGAPPFDECYVVTQQIADWGDRIITHRSVELNPEGDGAQIFDDVAFWNVVDLKTKTVESLQEVLSRHISEKIDASKKPELQIRAISRTGTYPYQIGGSEEDHDKTAAAWALMQYVSTYRSNASVISCQLCSELQDKVMMIRDKSGKDVKLGFTKTNEFLGLDENKVLRLDRENDYVRETLLKFPGYWLNGEDLFKLFSTYVAQERLASSDFKSYAEELLGSEEVKILRGSQPNILKKVCGDEDLTSAEMTELLKLFTNPRFCKFLIPLINVKDNINAKLTGEQIRNDIMNDVRERPFSATLDPKAWLEDQRSLLRAAKEKYNG